MHAHMHYYQKKNVISVKTYNIMYYVYCGRRCLREIEIYEQTKLCVQMGAKTNITTFYSCDNIITPCRSVYWV